MSYLFRWRTFAPLLAGIALGGLAIAIALNLMTGPVAYSHGQEKPAKKSVPEPGYETLQKEVERLKQGAGDQAHAMVSVAYHFNNLWFAGQHGNWPLAQFYLNETRSHLRWAVRIIPIRKDGAGQEIKLADILQAVENTPLKEMEEAIKMKNRDKFAASYRFTIEGCYACHKASDKAYLRLKVPTHPPESLIDFEPPPTVKDEQKKKEE